MTKSSSLLLPFMSAFRPRLAHWVLFAGGFLIRLACASRIPYAEAYGGWDGIEYWNFARHLANFAGDDYERFFGFIRSPGYSLLLVPLAWLELDPVRPVQCLQSFAGASLALVMAEVTTRWAGRIAGFIAFVITLFHPFLIIQAPFLLTESAFVLLLWIGMACLQRLDSAEPVDWTRWTVWAGVAIGLATLVRPALQLFLVLAAVWIGLRAPPLRRIAGGLWNVSLFTVVVSALLLPWQIGNRLVYREFTLGLGYGQAVFLLSNSMEYFRMCEATTKAEYYRYFQPTVEQIGRTNGLPRDQWMPVARRFKTEHPAEWRLLQWYKVRHFLRPWVNPVIFGRPEVLASGAVGVPLFAAALLEPFRRRGRMGAFGWLILGLAFTGFLVGGILFSASVRYRVPMVDVGFIILAASFFGNLGCNRRGHATKLPPENAGAADLDPP